MIGTAIVLGEHIQALGLARQAHRQSLKVVLAVKNRFSVARFSNTVDKVLYYSDDDSLLSALQSYRDSKALLFPSSDDMVEFLNKNRKELESFFAIGIPDENCVNLFADKRNTYRFCEAEGIAHPESHYLSSLDDAPRIAETVLFPVIIKPAVMYRFHALTRKKAILCNNKDELVARLEELSKIIPVSELIVQEFLKGGAESLFSYGAFVVAGEPRCWIVANRIRQNPMDFGNSTTFAISCDIPEIEESAKKILKITDYTGLAEVEFMYDATRGVYKFLEINTRAWKWHSISEGLGFGFFSEMIRFLNSEPPQFRLMDRRIAWVEMLTDVATISKEVLKGKMSLRKALASYRQKKVHAVWSVKDPLPAIVYVLISPVLFFIRH